MEDLAKEMKKYQETISEMRKNQDGLEVETEFTLQDSDPQAADNMIARLNKAQQDGTLSAMSKWKPFDLEQITQTLKTFKTQIECIDFVKYQIPQFYL